MRRVGKRKVLDENRPDATGGALGVTASRGQARLRRDYGGQAEGTGLARASLEFDKGTRPSLGSARDEGVAVLLRGQAAPAWAQAPRPGGVNRGN